MLPVLAKHLSERIDDKPLRVQMASHELSIPEHSCRTTAEVVGLHACLMSLALRAPLVEDFAVKLNTLAIPETAIIDAFIRIRSAHCTMQL